jgi:PAS domain S-box-containing protein
MPIPHNRDPLGVLQTVLGRVRAGLVGLDATFRYTYANQRAATILNTTRDELVGRRVWDVFPEARGSVVQDAFETALATQQPCSYERRDEALGRWFSVHVYPDADGLSLCFTDITDRKRREQSLQALTEEYEALLSNTEDAIFLIDVVDDGVTPTFRFARLSPAHEAATGLRSEDVEGKTPREALGDELGVVVERNYRRCVWARRPISYDEELSLPRGTKVWHTGLAPVIVDGRVTRIVGIGRDVTHRVERERELQRRNDRLDEFASVVSHDLRTPLNVARQHLRAAREQQPPSDLSKATDALDHMDAIVRDTLTLARQGDTVSDPILLPLDALIEESWELVETRDATLEVADAFQVEGDPGRLFQVFDNLFRNAIEHGGDDVQVRVEQDGETGFVVEDDGPGIPVDRRSTVFAPGHSSASGGTGFGLTIVRRIAEAHGWSVAVTEAANGGARFVFSDVELRPPA